MFYLWVQTNQGAGQISVRLLPLSSACGVVREGITIITITSLSEYAVSVYLKNGASKAIYIASYSFKNLNFKSDRDWAREKQKQSAYRHIREAQKFW